MQKSKVLLYGKKVSREELADEVLALINGTSARRPYPIPVKKVAKILGCSRTTVYQYINRGKEHPQLKSNGRLDLPKSSELVFREFNKNHPITSAILNLVFIFYL